MSGKNIVILLGDTKMKKILKLVALIVAAAILLVALGTYFFGERAIKIGIETAATKSLGVGVYVGGVDMKLLRGQIAIDNLEIRNPKGYTLENLLKIKRTSVRANLGSLMGDMVKIPEIKIYDIDLAVEQKGLSNNLKDIVGNIPSETPEKKEETEAAKPAKKLQIEDLQISEINVKIKLLELPGGVDTIPLKLVDIHMTNLGGEGDLDTGQLAKEIVLAITKGIAEQGKGLLPTDFINGIQGALQQAVQQTLEKTLEIGTKAKEEAGNILEKGVDSGKGAGEEIIKGVKGLFQKKKD